jgi:hypothetical protein
MLKSFNRAAVNFESAREIANREPELAEAV